MSSSHTHNSNGPLDPTQVSFADYTAWAAGGPGHAATPTAASNASVGQVYEPRTPQTPATHPAAAAGAQPSPLVEVLSSPATALSPPNALAGQQTTQNQNQNHDQNNQNQQVTRVAVADVAPVNNWPRSQAPPVPAHTSTHTALVQAPIPSSAATTYALCPHGILYNFCGLCYGAPVAASANAAPDAAQLLGLINNQNKTISQLSDQITILQANLQTVYTEFRGVKATQQAKPGPSADQLAGMQHDLHSTRQRLGVTEYRSSVLEANLSALMPLGSDVAAIKNQFLALEKRLSTPLPYTSATQASVAVINNEIHALKQHVATLDARSLAVDQSIAGIDWKANNAYRHLELNRTELQNAIDKVEAQTMLIGNRFGSDIGRLEKKADEMEKKVGEMGKKVDEMVEEDEEEEEGELETDEEG
ncbi:uncharacterized protein LOC62_02G002690 [Vanrija pseudolonga]|uniref:Uncharacterized protein n=1 Tax=Vanrija pseudolonga TaxID=143232 RepID=A0AAF1BIV3_9TREE|nr:hypothetical protein LOC62_02G002690 [Vanrija pseudolonga]